MTVASETQAWATGPLTAINYGEPCLKCGGLRGGEVNLVRRRWRVCLSERCLDKAGCTEMVRIELGIDGHATSSVEEIAADLAPA